MINGRAVQNTDARGLRIGSVTALAACLMQFEEFRRFRERSSGAKEQAHFQKRISATALVRSNSSLARTEGEDSE